MLISFLPIAYLVLRSQEIGLTKIFEILARPALISPLLNSLALAFLVGFSALAIGSCQAWLSVRSIMRFKRALAIGAIAPLAIPSYIAAYSWLAIYPGFSGLLAAWFVLTICTTPYVYLAMSAALVRGNRTAEEVARTLGYSNAQVIRLVAWPYVRPAAIGALLLVLLYVLSDFGAVSLLRFETFTRAIFMSYRAGFDRSTAAVLALVLVVISTALIAINARYRDFAERDSVSRTQSMSQQINRAKPLVTFFTFGWLSIGTLVPLGSLIYWNLRGRFAFEVGDLSRALLNTLGYAMAGGFVVVFFGVALAVLATRFSAKSINILERASWLSHALPGIVFALAFVYLSNKFVPSIYQTSALVVLAYVGLFLPNALAVLRAPIAQVPTSHEDAARSLGLNSVGVIRKVVLPAALPGILSASAFVMLTIVKELPVTLILRPTGIETMATKLWAATSVGSFAQAAPYGALLVVLAGIPALLLNQKIGRNLEGVIPTENGVRDAS